MIKEGEEKIEESVKEERKVRESENRKIEERIQRIEDTLIKERMVLDELEKKVEGEKKVKEIKESEKEMERKVEAAMEQIKILDMDFGIEIMERERLVKEAVKIIKEKVNKKDSEEVERILKGTRVYILGKSTGPKQTSDGEIQTVPVLLSCKCRRDKERMEELLRRAGLHVSFHWPKESLEFVKGVREEVERLGYGRKEYYTRLRPTLEEGRVMIRADCRRKEGGRFEVLAWWRLPPVDRTKWKWLNGLMRPKMK